MTSSGTYAFSPSNGEIVLAAFERIQVRVPDIRQEHMASLGHIAVGMAAARFESPAPAATRPSAAAMVFWSALSFLPDADVIGFGFGIAYGDPWGHRGATHSLLFALTLGVLVGVGARYFNRPALRTGVLAALVVASHGLLDTLTNGGGGIANNAATAKNVAPTCKKRRPLSARSMCCSPGSTPDPRVGSSRVANVTTACGR